DLAWERYDSAREALVHAREDNAEAAAAGPLARLLNRDRGEGAVDRAALQSETARLRAEAARRAWADAASERERLLEQVTAEVEAARERLLAGAEAEASAASEAAA